VIAGVYMFFNPVALVDVVTIAKRCHVVNNYYRNKNRLDNFQAVGY